MTPERFEEVERVCQSALDLPATTRKAFLDAACQGDPDLRAEVESLLAAASGAESFLKVRAAVAPTPTLTAGQRLGPYEVVKAIAAGGMGEVYEARDTRLGRTVAIKVLPAEVAGNPGRRARFDHEARAVAALDHPHICALYDTGREGDTSFLVMEYLEGQTLAERLAKGPLPLEHALRVAAEIADGLTAAHRHGIVHRDLKPGNVMLTKTGGARPGSPQAKLLDFGLAKLEAQAAGPSPTLSAPLTGEGVIVGTIQYMAPEQLEGKPADARTDIWALGAILFEMVTGRRAFEGTSTASVMTAILSLEPPSVSALQPLAPPLLDRLVRRCLGKSPDDRPDSAHDVADELRWLQEAGHDRLAVVHPRPRTLARTAMMVAAGLLLTTAGAGVMRWVRPSAPRAPLARLSLDVRPAEEVNGGGFPSQFLPTPGGSQTAFSWSPDGQSLVFAGRRNGVQQLYVRQLDAADAWPLKGTEGAQVPAVSPDGRWVAFWSGGTIRKVPLAGGPVMDLAPARDFVPFGLAWDARGRLFFGRIFGPVSMIPAEGGEPVAVTTLGETEVSHAMPWALPGGRALLYTVRKRYTTWGDEEVIAETLDTRKRTPLLQDAADARYMPSGHLVFLRRGVLFAVPFDAERLAVRGTPVAVLETVAQALTSSHSYNTSGAGQFAVAANGTLAWLPGSVEGYPPTTLVTVDRHGRVSPIPAETRSYAPLLRLSRDGRRLAVIISTLSETGVWVYDMDRGALTPVARGGETVMGPIWSPDGGRLVFDWVTGGRRAVVSQAADGTGPARVLAGGEFWPSSFTADGRQVAMGRTGDILLVTVDHEPARIESLIEGPAWEGHAEFSPDGRWLAYVSNTSGRAEVYVRPYPAPGPTVQVSVEGGSNVAWNRNGRELFFVARRVGAGKRRMMAADFAPGSPPRIGRPHVLFEFDARQFAFTCSPVRCYDVAADGQRFYTVMNNPPPPPVVTHINIIQNWLQEMKAKVQALR